MKFKIKTSQAGERDQFSKDLSRTEWTFKISTWLILIGTLQYAAEITGSLTIKAAVFYLSIEIGYLVFSFVNNRLELEIMPFDGKYKIARIALNVFASVFIGWCGWMLASRVIAAGAAEIVEFHRKGH